MNILLAFPFADNRTGIAIKEGFEEAGHNVCCVDAQEQPMLLNTISREYGDDFNLLLCSRTNDLYEDVIKIKKRKKDIKTAIWNPDVRIPIESWGGMLHFFSFVDYYFDASEGMVEKMKEVNPNSHYLPQGIHRGQVRPMKPTELMKEKYGCDVGFIGNFVRGIHDDRALLMKAFEWNRFSLKRFEGIFGELHNYVVSCCKINLCHSVEPKIKNSYSVRNWQVLGAKGLGLDLYHEGIEETFHGGIYSYKTIEEAPEVADYILKNYDTCMKKVERAYNIAIQNDLYRNRCRQMLRIING